MKQHNPTRCSRRKTWAWWTLGLASIVWLVLRSGANPRRLAYPCQRAALASALAFLGYLASLVGMAQLYRLLKRKTSLGTVGLVGLTLLVVLAQASSTVRPAGASSAVTLDLPEWTSATAVSNVYVAQNVPPPQCSLDGGSLPATGPCSDPAYALADAGVDALIDEMERRGEPFHATSSHPDGIVATDEVVVIKINNQWGAQGEGSGWGRLVTSSDVLKGLIWRVLQHPDGFSGEVVVAENTQWVNNNWDTTPANAEDRDQSYQDVVNTFQSLGYPVSVFSWDDLSYPLFRGTSVGGGYPSGEFINGNNDNGYVLLEDPDGGGTDELSYPKFETTGGTSVSMRYGVWEGSGYDSDRLALINLPVLKVHCMAAATIAWKNLIGFVTIEDDSGRYGDWDTMHDFYWGYTGGANRDYGLIGRQLALVRAPDLNIVDAVWVGNQDNTTGTAVRADVLVASSDPFAVDWYASEYVLRPVADSGWVWPQNVSAARAGVFRDATRTNQNAAATVWPGGSYPYIDLLDGYDGDTPSSDEANQMNVYLAGSDDTCTLTCTATVAGTAAVGEAVGFAATASASGCSGQPSFWWDFGDDDGSGSQNTTHSYDSPGSYDWTLTVSADDQTCTRQGTVVISGGGADYDLLVPAVVHAPGASNSQWRTALTCLNLSSAAAQLTLTLVTGDGSEMRTHSLAGNATVAWGDVAVDLFGASPQVSTAGAVHIAADRAILVTSRTYNQAQLGTYGQYLPALDDGHCLGDGETGYLLQLANDADFRTNVGYANPGGASCDLRVQLFDADGTAIGDLRELTVAAGEWRQDNDIFALTGAGSHDLAYATVEVLGGGGRVWAYASVVDNHTNDATTIPVLVE